MDKINVGRAFFHYDDIKNPDSLRSVVIHNLDSHVGNVVELIQNWQMEGRDARGSRIFRSPKTAQDLHIAAILHDCAKDRHFSLNGQYKETGECRGYNYSFKGHRFDIESRDDYKRELARGHHDYSVSEIIATQARFGEDDKRFQRYPVDLYILEMCDQIDAELSVRILGNEEDKATAESRVFMDYTLSDENGEYQLDPWPFTAEAITLTYRARAFDLTNDQQRKLQSLKSSGKDDPRGRLLTKWVKASLRGDSVREEIQEPVICETITIILRPLINGEDNPQETLDVLQAYQRIWGTKWCPNAMQQEVYEKLMSDDAALLLKAPTGSGKTEAVLVPSLTAGRRLILPLPARSLVEDQEGRVAGYLQTLSGAVPGRQFSLIVDTGDQSKRIVFCNGQRVRVRDKGRWCDHQRRHLYKADVILTTLDKFLYRFFGFGDKAKSYSFPLRISDGARTMVCFDEAHSYDSVSFINFCYLVRALYEAGQSIVVMTATMPSAHQKDIHFLPVVDYLDDEERASDLTAHGGSGKRTLRYIEIDDEHADDGCELVVQQLVTQVLEQRDNGKRRIIVASETVQIAARVYKDLQDEGLSEHLTLYHGRLADEVRPDIYKQLKKRDESWRDGATGQPYILVTTSAIEVGCDLNAEVLITELCNPENLIQRSGRCNRRNDVTNALIIIVADSTRGIPGHVSTLTPEQERAYVTYLAERNGQLFDARAIAAHIGKQPSEDYRVETLFQMLYEYVYEARIENAPLYERGFIITRSWEPTITFRVPWEDEIHHISVSLRQSVVNKSRGETRSLAVALQEYRYDPDENCFKPQPLRSGLAYTKRIIAEVGQDKTGVNIHLVGINYTPELGLVDVPKVFEWRKRSHDYMVRLGFTDEDRDNIIIRHYAEFEDEGQFTEEVVKFTIPPEEDIEDGA